MARKAKNTVYMRFGFEPVTARPQSLSAHRPREFLKLSYFHRSAKRPANENPAFFDPSDDFCKDAGFAKDVVFLAFICEPSPSLSSGSSALQLTFLATNLFHALLCA